MNKLCDEIEIRHRDKFASNIIKLERKIVALVCLVATVCASGSRADTFPSKPLRIVTAEPGGGSDFLGRVLADGLRAQLKESVVVQNLAGAGSVVGSAHVAKAKPDGYTLLLNHIGLSTVPALYKKLQFDPLAAYEFVGLFAEAPMVIMARKEFAPKNYAELVAYARQHREKFTMASSGMGSSTHLCAIIFQQALGVPITIVQYKGAGPAVIDVRSGQVDAICDLPTTTSSMIRSGDLRAYLLTAPQRMSSLPDVPTAKELGVPSLAIGVELLDLGIPGVAAGAVPIWMSVALAVFSGTSTAPCSTPVSRFRRAKNTTLSCMRGA
mgnify:CR=1 FL=1